MPMKPNNMHGKNSRHFPVMKKRCQQFAWRR